MSYFKSFPFVQYTFPDNISRTYTNIALRPDLVKEIKDPSQLEYYSVNDGETPETIAHNKYNDVTLNWIIMLANDIMNLYTDWPKSTEAQRDYLYSKYRVQKDTNGINRTLTDSQVLEFIEFAGTASNGYFSYIDIDSNTRVKIQPHHFLDSNGNIFTKDSGTNTKNAFGHTIDSPTLTPVSIFDWEDGLNDKKKNIFLPSYNVAARLKRELKAVMNG